MERSRIQGILVVKSVKYWLQFGELERHLGVDPRYDLKQRANRIDDFALRFDTAAGEIDHLGIGAFGAIGAGVFKPVDALEHQRSDCEDRENDQPGANAQNRLVPPRRFL